MKTQRIKKLDRAIGTLLRNWRKEQGITQQRLCDMAMLEYGFCISQQVLSCKEYGRSSFSLVEFVSLASVLGVVPQQAFCELLRLLE